jgi:folate-dependent phosphoribosylglycinamide formyltransferase PurN
MARTVLICHAESRLNREAIGSWMASISNLAGIVVIQDRAFATWKRLRHEVRRIGIVRLLDVIAYRIYYALFLSRKDSAWLERRLELHRQAYPGDIGMAAVLQTDDPNSKEVERFIRELSPDYAIARCKHILHERIFAIPNHGTFVLHPGICPEYRNAHGSFWALAREDRERVGLTLLRVDRGVDTGPVYGYYHCSFDEAQESHIVIMTKLALDNLDAIAARLHEICEGQAATIDTAGRPSAVWGQPWLSAYLRWKRRVNRRGDAIARP